MKALRRTESKGSGGQIKLLKLKRKTKSDYPKLKSISSTKPLKERKHKRLKIQTDPASQSFFCRLRAGDG